ncbi:MAG: tRNA (cytidine(34)-2'-O)-methyltransferase [Betaproteobacteria bacterium]|nr:tRNA (cytidine(34)-2'-O)-methyltransferase [Betaproteobacteria bacterium]
MFEIILYQPEIPPNAGNIIRLAANTGCHLHLVRPMGFQLNDRELKRAGMDYRDLTNVTEHACWEDCKMALSDRRMFALSTRAARVYTTQQFHPGDAFVFGPETRGLPSEVLSQFPENLRLRLPMNAANRSLNLANCVAVTIYEAWRQNAFGSNHPV